MALARKPLGLPADSNPEVSLSKYPAGLQSRVFILPGGGVGFLELCRGTDVSHCSSRARLNFVPGLIESALSEYTRRMEQNDSFQKRKEFINN